MTRTRIIEGAIVLLVIIGVPIAMKFSGGTGEVAPPPPSADARTSVPGGGRRPVDSSPAPPAGTHANLQRIGPAPASRIFFGATASRLHAGGWLSDDGGRTWQLLTGFDGKAVVPVGGRHLERSCAASAQGRILCAEVLYQQAAEATGQGDLASVAEWTGSEWTTVVPARQTAEPVPPPMDTRVVSYLPDGNWVVVTRNVIRSGDGRSAACPADVRDVVVAKDGKVYFAAERDTGFGLYVADSLGEPWAPVAGATRVLDIAEGAGTVYAAGDRLGRGSGISFQWTPWPASFSMEHLVAHPSAPLVAAWGRYGFDRQVFVVSRDGGLTLRQLDLDVRVLWAAFDPASTDSMLIVDETQTLYRLAL